MIKSALIGVWVCAVTVGSAYIGTQWQPGEEKQVTTAPNPLGKMSQVKLKPLHIPVLNGDKVTGYVICQLGYLAPAEKLKGISVKPDVFILDAAYKNIYTASGLDVTQLKKESWPAFAKAVKDEVNARYGSEVLQEILIEEFGFVPADVARKGQEPRTVAKGSDAASAEKKRKAH